jgi:hypothetical protein
VQKAVGTLVATIAFVVWQFSTFFGLDISTGGSVFGRLVAIVVATGAAWKFGEDFDPIRLGNIWPILLALLWCCWWPALDFWENQQQPSFMRTDEVSIWWDAWYRKWGGVRCHPQRRLYGKEISPRQLLVDFCNNKSRECPLLFMVAGVSRL